jgi:energy-converting hydrogenase Eha subunit C
MMTAFLTSIIIVELVVSGMLGAYLSRCAADVARVGDLAHNWSTYGFPLARK